MKNGVMTMRDNLLETMEITVMRDTAEGLRKIAGEIERTPGEVVDRLAIRMSPKDPDVAGTLLIEESVVVTAALSTEDRRAVYKNIARAFVATIPPRELDAFIDEVKAYRENLIREIANLPEEKREALIESLQRMAPLSDQI